MGYSEYKDLTPIDNINNGDEYLNALEWALNNPKVKNIALAGPYGAGKSSIIETYLSREKDKKNIYEQHKFAKKYLKISMATFIEAHNNEGNETKIEIDADEVEKGILKQLFYKVEHKKIPQSRYRKLQPIHSMNVLVKVIMTSIILILFGEIFFPDICKNIWNKIDAFAMRYSWLVGKTAGVAIVLAIVGIGITSYLAKIIMSRFRVKELKLPADTTLQVSEDTEESVFNKNLDEIMYFFEETQYQLIFFEDLDRLENRKIFVHLRELNNLLNNDEAINHKPIVFVYAVRDDIFSKEDRTKFFDFIIPVIPIVNATNSGEILLEKLDNAKEHGICHKISQGFVLDIAPFISDMRIIQNIYNEFVVYKKTLQTEQHLNLSDEQMMAIIIFKNLYPSDFADIQGEKGIIKKAFQDRNVYVFTKIKELQQKIDSNTELVEKTTQNIFKSVRELKYAFLVEITEGEGVARGFNGYPGRISSANVLSDNFDLHQFQEKDYRAEYVSFSGHTGVVDMSEKVDVVDEYIKRCEAIKKYTDKNIEKIKEEIIELKNKKQKLSSRSIQWLIENDSSENVLSKEVKDNKFLVFLLRRGYLDEKYANYINYFKGKFIEVNVDKLSVEKNNYVTDNFAKDIINAKFEDSVLKKLLPVLPMKTFDLDVEQLPENILAIMVECNYFGYTIEYYQSIAERNEDIAVEYIVKNQAEFYNSLEDFSMTKNVLERLLFEQKIPMDNREELFEKYAKTYMTEKIALNMNAEGFKVTKTLFDIAWEILSENQKERLMIANLELLNVDDMEKCFGELSGQYSVLTERTKRRNIKLDNTANNRKLVDYLKKIDYITSFWEEEKTEPNGNRQVISIGCKIKQKK